MDKFILYSRKGGWYTKTSQLHSDWTKAQIFDRDEATDMVKLHSGVLMPVAHELYSEVMKGVKP